ncbi:MAG: hypothetical protein JXQ85_05155 [Cognatishimia sp.]|uniref:hypothetical protein n=1 Tax=Cognatishimia sp. TaxID=2211648 RepID=UPI003B8C7304
MVILLRIFGWFWLSVTVANAALKVFGTVETIQRYAGGSRNLDLNLLTIAICLVFLALASILSEVRALKESN